MVHSRQNSRSEDAETVPDASALTGLAAKARDLEAIRDAMVAAAAVSGGLWLSYLFALFYLLVAVGGVTYKDLFLENPVKLPFLSLDLPLKLFFWLGPVIFLVEHTYVLLHFRMLAAKVRLFDSELRAQIDPDQEDSEVRTWLREQLPNDIFVQFLAGTRETRTGWTGRLLRLIAWFSLVIGPVALLVFFQLQFLPYHHILITWWQRIVVLVDLILIWMLWSKVIGPSTRFWRVARFCVDGTCHHLDTLSPLFNRDFSRRVARDSMVSVTGTPCSRGRRPYRSETTKPPVQPARVACFRRNRPLQVRQRV